MNIDQVLTSLNPEIIERFKRAVETKKWPDGRELTAEQLETCMQAIIVYEHRHVNESERTGYVPPKETPCSDDKVSELKWKK